MPQCNAWKGSASAAVISAAHCSVCKRHVLSPLHTIIAINTAVTTMDNKVPQKAIASAQFFCKLYATWIEQETAHISMLVDRMYNPQSRSGHQTIQFPGGLMFARSGLYGLERASSCGDCGAFPISTRFLKAFMLMS